MHARFADIFSYLKYKTYPKEVLSKGDKGNFRRQTKPFIVHNNELYHLNKAAKRKVIWSRDEQQNIIKLVHEGNDVSVESKALSGVLFSLRVRKHKSTGFSPFSLLYQREAVLPIDLDCNLIDFNDDNALSNDDSSNKKIISETFYAMNKMKNELFDEAYQNIKKISKKAKT
ncbi:uncharacterized protein LOC136076274 [Hydra vulgaris]|uniref:Uncharacterized protein LOC136076274 n=1 Tax=Hydra vulgaris TaxID=6087 RepID=A0ABM4BAC2_HYDVU